MTTPAPANVLDKSVADVSFLAGMLVDKFCYHLPLYRQHQRLMQAGIRVSRSSLTSWPAGPSTCWSPSSRPSTGICCKVG